MSSSGYVGDVRLFETPYKHAVRYAVIRQSSGFAPRRCAVCDINSFYIIRMRRVIKETCKIIIINNLTK